MGRKKLMLIVAVTVVLIIVLILSGVLAVKIYHKINLNRILKEHYDSRVATFEMENKSLKETEVDVAFLGDSITEGYDLSRYYPQYTTANRGINGDTTFGLEKRLKVSAYDINPKVCVVLIGTNNYDDMFDNYEKILSDLKTNLPHSKIVVLSLTAIGENWTSTNDVVKENNEVLKSLSKKHSCTYVDIFTPLYDTKNDTIYQQYTLDSVHLTDSGYEVFTKTLTPVLEELLSE